MALWRVDAKGGQPSPFPPTSDLGANIESPVYSPDGKSLAFCLSHDTPTQIWVVNLETRTRMQLTEGSKTVYDPAWAPDSNTLVVSVIDGPAAASGCSRRTASN